MTKAQVLLYVATLVAMLMALIAVHVAVITMSDMDKMQGRLIETNNELAKARFEVYDLRFRVHQLERSPS